MPSNAEAMLVAVALMLGGCGGGASLPDAPTGSSVPEISAPDPGQAADPGAAYAPPGAAPAPTDGTPPTMPPPRYDNVGYAGWSDDPGAVGASHRTLPPGSFAEVTSLDTGKTILVAITGTARSNREIELSGSAAQQLGLEPGMQAGVRVRAVNPGEADQIALRSGQPAAARPDTPPVLLNPLRKKLGGTPAPRPATRPAPVASTPRPPVPTRPAPVAAANGYYVQIAALSDSARATALARSLGGSVVAGGGLFRVRTGPYRSEREAVAARDGIARRGYGEARIVRPN